MESRRGCTHMLAYSISVQLPTVRDLREAAGARNGIPVQSATHTCAKVTHQGYVKLKQV